jgi:sugar phosphate isomerase/epimerase
MMTRRQFGKLGLAALPTMATAGKIDSTVNGVRLGVSGYSFQALPLDAAVAATARIGLGATEVWFRHIEPKLPREQLREWRLSVPLETYQSVARKYENAGIDLAAFTFDMKEDCTDGELDRAFQMARALGVSRIATSTTFTVAERIVPLMAQYRMEVAFHGHTDSKDRNQFAGPESFARGLMLSPYARINLDIGQYTVAGFDPVPLIREYYEKIPVIHLRDGAPGKGTKLTWGTGTTPIREVLALLRDGQYPVAADIEYDYSGASEPEREITRCFEFCRDALR